ncbi:unannotated protein [freshwater metagenome]|uniref:Unannotated protein n=1 Tax=freshwater metagenome TaxID=449393 RepID=A0A6J7PHP9_9ZZZZ
MDCRPSLVALLIFDLFKHGGINDPEKRPGFFINKFEPTAYLKTGCAQ